MARQRLATGRSAQFVDPSGVNGQFAQAIEVMTSSVQASTYATSGLRYYPIVDGGSFGIQFRATRTGRLWILLSYAMSVSNGGDMTLDSEEQAVADGESVDAAPAAGDTFNWTPGTGATRKTRDIDTGFDVVEGDDVTFVFTRNDGGGAHTGSLNLISMLASVKDA